MDAKNNITVLLQPGPQTDPSFSNSNKNNEFEDDFQNILEEATHKVKQTSESSSSQTEHEPKRTHHKKTDSSKPVKTQDQRIEGKNESQDSKNTPQNESASFESDLPRTQSSKNAAPSPSIKKDVSMDVSEDLLLEKLKSMGLDHRTIQAFLALMDAKAVQIDDKQIQSLLNSLTASGDLMGKAATTNQETFSSDKTSQDLMLEKLKSIGLDNQTSQDFLAFLDSQFIKIDNEQLQFLLDADENELLNVGAIQMILGEGQDKFDAKAGLVNLEQRAVGFLQRVGVDEDAAKQVVRQIMRITAETKIDQEKLLKLAELQPSETSGSKTDSKNKILKEGQQQGLEIADDSKFKISSKELQEQVIKNSKIEAEEGKLNRQESSDSSKIRIQEPITRQLKTDAVQQNQTAELRVQAAGLNFQNTQDSLAQFHQNLAKTTIEVLPQNKAMVSENFANTLNELEINRPVLPKGVSERNIVDQVIKKFSIRGGGQNSEIKMRLEPPSLGTVRMNVTTQGDAVKTTIFAESQAVKQVIENNLSQLKDSFSEQGLKVESFQVMVGGESGHKNQQQEQPKKGYRVPLDEEDSLISEQIVNLNDQNLFSKNVGSLSVII